MRDLEFNKALDAVWLMIRSLNQYLEDVKPWSVAKTKDIDPEAAGHLEEILLHAVGTLEQVAELLSPFPPTTSAAITTIFRAASSRRTRVCYFQRNTYIPLIPHASKS